MYLVRRIEKNGTKCKPFTLDLEGVTKLLSMATPCKCSFEIEKIN